MGRRFGPASVQYDDWHGTVALDNPDDVHELERIAGIDHEQWTVCGMSIFGGEGVGVAASVLAVRRNLVGQFDDWARVTAGNGGAVPVTEFDLPSGTALGLLQRFKRWTLHATPREAIAEQGLDLEVVETVPPRDGDSYPGGA